MNQNISSDVESMNLLFTMREHTQTAQLEAQKLVDRLNTQRRNLSAPDIRNPYTHLTDRINYLSERISLNSRFKQAQLNAQPHIVAAKTESMYLPQLVAAPLLEVDNVVNATYLVDLRNTKGWLGSACLDVNALDEALLGEIINVLEAAAVPTLHFKRNQQGHPVFL
ncbi:hypothetical protein POM88_020824 [Heracleum sosnowskyi]|uniref:Uncharacterized protein n=1 Tax=Heracleum sosnowskyi TaxID=360622 RepID=A0AAD8MSB4_9APIA|nr:hypothetical protein POM88_020824 [Heracleum sosnowskyi]